MEKISVARPKISDVQRYIQDILNTNNIIEAKKSIDYYENLKFSNAQLNQLRWEILPFINSFENKYNIPEPIFEEIKAYLINAINKRIAFKVKAYEDSNLAQMRPNTRQMRKRSEVTQQGGSKNSTRKKR